MTSWKSMGACPTEATLTIRGSGPPEQGQQETGQQERRQVVGGESKLVAIDALLDSGEEDCLLIEWTHLVRSFEWSRCYLTPARLRRSNFRQLPDERGGQRPDDAGDLLDLLHDSLLQVARRGRPCQGDGVECARHVLR
jgi:hypothetical protein